VSTHPQHATEPNPTTEPTPGETATRTAPSTDDTGRERDDTPESWVARCQSQFETGDSARLRNLADGENHAMPDGV